MIVILLVVSVPRPEGSHKGRVLFVITMTERIERTWQGHADVWQQKQCSMTSCCAGWSRC